MNFETYIKNVDLKEEFKEWLKTHPQAFRESPMVAVIVFVHDLFQKWRNDWESLNNLAEQFKNGGRGSEKVVSDVAYI